MAFEETAEELTQNVASLGFDLAAGRAEAAVVDYVHVERSEIEEAGEYDLEGLFIRLGTPIDSSAPSASCSTRSRPCSAASTNQASCAPNSGGCSAGSRTKVSRRSSPAERGDGTLTRHGLEEYVSDCVILLDHRVTDQCRRAACASSNIAARPTAPTSIRS